MSDFIIEAHNICKTYGSKTVLNGLNLQLPAGGVHAVVGGNGAGKSTLFRILLGLVEPTSGQSSILGCDSMALDGLTRAKIGYVNEDHALPEWMTVKALTNMQKKHYSQWQDDAYQAAISTFFLSPEQKISQLSRGERAGLSLAMALAQQPQVLILDEPTLGLDVVAKQSFLESLLFREANDNCTILFCSHHTDEIERIADSLIIMEQGVVKELETPESFCQRIEFWVAEFDASTPAPPNNLIPDLLQLKKIDQAHHYMLLDHEHDFGQFLRQYGAVETMLSPVSLDRAINAYLTRSRHLKQMGVN
jgi:ABC-2 type transport system ATP-binding protein